MTRARRIFLNTAWLTIAQALTSIAALFVTGYVASGLGTSSYGEMELSVAFVNFFSPIIFAGIQIPLIRHIVNDAESRGRTFGDGLIIRLCLTPVFVGFVLLIAPFAIPQVRPALVWLAVAYTFLVFYAHSLTVPIEAAERMHFMSLGTIIMTAVGMVLSVVAVMAGMGPEAVLGARTTGMGVCIVYLIVVLAVSFYRPKFQIDGARYKELAKQGAPLAFSFLLGLVLLEVDKLMLPHLLPSDRDGFAAVGIYQSATVLAYKFEMIIIPFTTAITPPLVAALGEGRESFQGLLGRSLRFTLILGLPVAVGTGFICVDIVDFIFGADYLEASSVLGILIWFVPLQFLNRVLAAAIAVSRRERWVAIAVGLALCLNVVANAILVPVLELQGAAVATVISESFLVLIYVLVVREHFFGMFQHLKLVRVALAVTVMGVACYLIQGSNALIVIGVAALSYIVLVLGLRCVTKDELRALRGQ